MPYHPLPVSRTARLLIATLATLAFLTPALAQDVVLDEHGRIYHPLQRLSDTALGARVLATHNAERQRLGLPALRWNERLAADARIWAEHLARDNRTDLPHDMVHADREGENLWAGSIHDYTPEEMVSAWIDERQEYKPGVFPNVSTTGDWEDVGHYTQIIWEDTREVGCALASNHNDEYLVCRYAKPGNWDGEPAIHSH